MKIGYAQDVITPSLINLFFLRALATTAALTGYEAIFRAGQKGVDDAVAESK